MPFPIDLFYIQVGNLLPDRLTTEASDANVYQQIKQAVIDYGRLKPDTITIDLAGDGGKYYAINSTNLPGYSDKFSRIESIQYPAEAVSEDASPVYLAPEDWDEDYYVTAASVQTRYLFLPNHAPAASETMRITYQGLYVWTLGTATTAVTQAAHGFSVNDYVYKNASNVWVTAGANANLLATHKVTAVGSSSTFTATILAVTVPEIDFFAICNRAACLICTEISARYSRTSDSTINADSVNHPGRAEMFAARARDYCGRWSEAMGLGNEEGSGDYLPASEFVDWDTSPGWPGGRRFIFHGGEVR
jgi:hypothetical protein